MTADQVLARRPVPAPTEEGRRTRTALAPLTLGAPNKTAFTTKGTEITELHEPPAPSLWALCPLWFILSEALVLALGAPSYAALSVAAPFSDHMVLQCETEVPVWGRADAGERVTVSFAGQTGAATADGEGRWTVRLDPMTASGVARSLVVRGSPNDEDRIEVTDVLVGEVWLCAGQSNMGWSIKKRVKNAEKEKAEANYPLIRIGNIGLAHGLTPQDDVPIRWKPILPGYDGAAVPYFFGRKLHRELKVPIGLLHSSWGGASVESFTRREVVEQHPDFRGKYMPIMKKYQAGIDNKADEKNRPLWLAYKKKLDAYKALSAEEKKATSPPPRPRYFPSVHPRSCPTALYNGMLHPLIPYAMRGAVWYQGEANVGTGRGYERLLGDMMADWRGRWGQGDFTFVFAQLPGIGKVQTTPAETRGWMHIREAMRRTLKLPNTGMAVLIDVGETNNIHCWNKVPASERLALWALAMDYGRDIVRSGPLYRSHEKIGNRFVIRFDSAGSGLAAASMTLEGSEWRVEVRPPGEEEIRGFAIAGDGSPPAGGKSFVWAKARIAAPDTLEVWSDDIPDPIAVRYGWAGFPVGNLYNVEKLPASPFTTED